MPHSDTQRAANMKHIWKYFFGFNIKYRIKCTTIKKKKKPKY